MKHILEIKNLSKDYGDFMLRNISFSVPAGTIACLIGKQGAGKRTMLKLILNLARRDCGEINIFGMDNMENETQIKQDIGVVFERGGFPEGAKIKDISRIFRHLYKNWDSSAFFGNAERFLLPQDKPVGDYSAHEQMKLSAATAFSHRAKLLIVDHTANILEPPDRELFLDMLFDFTKDKRRSVLIASDAAGELERVGGHFALIHHGKLIFFREKEFLLRHYAILTCSHADLAFIDKSGIVGYKENENGVDALVQRAAFAGKYVLSQPNIETMISFFTEGEQNN